MTQSDEVLDIQTPRWALPLLEPARYKGAKGGRYGGKSHFFAESVVEACAMDYDKKVVCLREYQKSLKFSVKALIEEKIRKFRMGSLFDVYESEIRSKHGNGLIIFEGMQSHNADSIKSLEDFDIAWFEEARKASKRSLEILIPTIRKEGSELWFGWNPEEETDPIENLLVHNPPPGAVVVECNYLDNPFLSNTAYRDAEQWRIRDPEAYQHIFLGGYNIKGDAQIFRGKWVLEEFTPGKDWNGPYYGLDFGFSQDPTAATKSWVHENTLFIEEDAGKVGLDLDDTTEYLVAKMPGIEKHTIRADSARPESISYLRRHGLPKIIGAKKGPNSVEDGIEHIKSYDRVVIHPRCKGIETEARLYCYKVDKLTGDILAVIVDQHNHYWDATRYALEPIMKSTGYNLKNVR